MIFLAFASAWVNCLLLKKHSTHPVLSEPGLLANPSSTRNLKISEPESELRFAEPKLRFDVLNFGELCPTLKASKTPGEPNKQIIHSKHEIITFITISSSFNYIHKLRRKYHVSVSAAAGVHVSSRNTASPHAPEISLRLSICQWLI